ncbi:MAG: hypothetical protein FJ387_21435 [Verrucomicrobia bacterium]|nr:hypothetical protein [Verrucomicrobiota bacterium]
MAHLWISGRQKAWLAVRLPDTGVALFPDRERPVRTLSPSSPPSAVRLRCCGPARHAGPVWVLIGGATHPVRVNGDPLSTGLRLLRDRDEIQLDAGVRLYFSAEEVAEVRPFPGATEKVFCPRCKLELNPGEPAVRCPAPQCGIWHHQTDQFNCWTYSGGCALCGHPTELAGGLRWTPDQLKSS